jgi:hypothetical protein
LLSEEYGYVVEEGVRVSVTETDDAPVVPNASGYKAHKRIRFEVSKGEKSSAFHTDLFFPYAEGDIPLIIDLDFSISEELNYFPLQLIMEKKVAVARIHYSEVTADSADFDSGIAPLVCDRSDPHSAGKLAIWVYAAGLVGKYMLEKGYVSPHRLFVSGHSRLGKTALLAAATYEFFEGAHSNCSGCCGAAISREKDGETVEKIVNKFPYWFTPEFAKYAGRENEMPFDQHYLTALIAPRKISIVTAKEDEWADAEAQYLTAEATSVIYEKLGVAGFDRSRGFLGTGMKSTEGNIVLSKRDGRHRFFPEDWEFFIDSITKQ